MKYDNRKYKFVPSELIDLELVDPMMIPQLLLLQDTINKMEKAIKNSDTKVLTDSDVEVFRFLQNQPLTQFGQMVAEQIDNLLETENDPFEEKDVILTDGKMEVKLNVWSNGHIQFENGQAVREELLPIGYMIVKIPGFKKMVYVHRLVAEAFFGYQEGKVVDHKDGNKLNNSKDNLRWVDYSENSKNRRFKWMAPKKMEKHVGEVLVATDSTGKRLIFNSVKEATQALGVSHVIIYRCANPEDWPQTAKGYSFKWEKVKKETSKKGVK